MHDIREFGPAALAAKCRECIVENFANGTNDLNLRRAIAGPLPPARWQASHCANRRAANSVSHRVTTLLPWWMRIGAKVVLSRLPVRYSIWRRLNLFGHGAMHRADYALRVFQQHFARTQLQGKQGFVAIELGPGDSLSSALVAAAHGASQTYLIDAGPFATSEMVVYREMAAYLRDRGFDPPSLDGVHDVPGLLRACRASYGFRGLDSLREVPTASVDFIWSHAVLEHVRRHEFAAHAQEMRRVLRDNGVGSHQVDLQDHLGGALNNMRIPSRWWEAEWMARSGFYTNRLRRTEIIRTFEEAGFAAAVATMQCWDALPTPRRALADEFAGLDTQELLVQSFELVVRPS